MSYLARFLRLIFASLALAGVAGGGCGGTAAQPKPTMLNFPVMSAAYSLALDRIVILQTPQAAQLHLLDGHTLADDVIPLDPLTPQQIVGQVAVTPDGTHAVVTLLMNLASANPSGAVAYVDLAARKVIGTTYPIPSPPSTVVASNTTAYVLTETGNEQATIYSVDLKSGATSVALSGLLGWPGESPPMALSPDGQTLYVCTPHPSTRADTLTSFAAEGAQLTQMSSVMPDVFCAAGLATSRDGSRLYLMGTPEVLSAANLSKISSASTGAFVRFVDDPSNGQPVAELAEKSGLEGASLGSNLLLEDPSTFAVKSNTALATLSSGDAGALQPTGLGVFCDAAGTTRFVLIEYQGLSDPEYAIVSM
jgi:hypothetical protein